MDYLTDDTLSYLTESFLNYSNYKLLASFITCRMIKSIVGKMINDKLKRNYKLIVRDNSLENPLRIYSTIYKIYNDKFTLNMEKIKDLLVCSLKDNNIELFRLLYKTMPNFIKSDHVQNEMMHILFNIIDGVGYFANKSEPNEIDNFYLKNPNIFRRRKSHIVANLVINDLKEGKFDLITLPLFEKLLQNYYEVVAQFKLKLKMIIQDKKYREILVTYCLTYDDIHMLELFIGDSDINNMLAYSISVMGRNIPRYIMDNHQYTIGSVINHLEPLVGINDARLNRGRMAALLLNVGIKI